MTVLISGFGAFGPVPVNPSESLVKDLAKRFAYATVVLDVSYERCFPRLREEIKRVQPHLLLLTGVARGGSGLRLEMRARNIATAMLKDVDGVVGAGQALSSHYSKGDFIYTDVDTLTLAASLCRAGFDARVSTDAGGYVCNALYYHALEQLDIPVLFLHIPPYDDVTWTRERLAEAAHALLGTWQSM